MTETQKIIKYIAIALAALLIVGIVSGIYFAGAAIISIFEDDGNEEIGEIEEMILDEGARPSRLDVEIAAAEVTVKAGDTLKIETNNSRISCSVKGNTLKIVEEGHGLFYKGNNKSVLIITLPEDLIFDEADIEAGAGRLLIESLSASELSLDLGAGETVIDSLSVSGETEINAGAGRLKINSAEIGHIEVNQGVGELDVTVLVKNGGEFNCGVGSVTINLVGGKDDYSVNVEKGLGEIKIDGESVSNKKDRIYGTGSSRIEINGGVGAASISFN